MRAGALIAGVLVASSSFPLAHGQEAMPRDLAGAWRIVRVLPVHASGACWTEKQAVPLVGTELRYSASALRWHGGLVPLTGITTRTVDASDLAQEEPRGDASIHMADLGFNTPRVEEVNLQHDDADITGATTEVPGDSVLLTGPNRMVLSACGVYLEAHRTTSAPSALQTREATSRSTSGARHRS